MSKSLESAAIPMKAVGPIKIVGTEVNSEIKVPLATFEKPLWHSVNRGARISRLTSGIKATITRDCMTRSIIVQANDAQTAYDISQDLQKQREQLSDLITKISNFTTLEDWHTEIVGNLLYLRFALHTADAAGHNMVTKAAQALQTWLLNNYPQLKYISISGNHCVDKKNSAINGILGRGKQVIAEIIIPHVICVQYLRTTPEKIVELNIKKNLLGSIIAGSVRSANAHFANMLLAFYLATGQDAANIVEGSQGITFAEIQNDSLYFSVTLPNIIVGSVGVGKDLDFVIKNLQLLGCKSTEKPARRLAIIAAATVLCGELSLLAAQTSPDELMRAHTLIERAKKS